LDENEAEEDGGANNANFRAELRRLIPWLTWRPAKFGIKGRPRRVCKVSWGGTRPLWV